MSQCCCVNVQDDAVNLDTLLRHVAIYVPELPYEVAIELVRQRYIEFARKTRLLVSHQTINLQRDVRNYPLEPPAGYQVFSVLGLGDNNTYFYYPNPNQWYWVGGNNFRLFDNKQIQFQYAPSQDYEQCIILHVIPTDCVDTIPSEIATPYGKGIAMGAVADALSMPNKGWSNPNASADKRREFYREVQNGLSMHINNRGANPAMFKPLRIL
jgi:hypothetical protein